MSNTLGVGHCEDSGWPLARCYLVAFICAPVTLLKPDKRNPALLHGKHPECLPLKPSKRTLSLLHGKHPECLPLKGDSILYLYNCMVSHELSYACHLSKCFEIFIALFVTSFPRKCHFWMRHHISHDSDTLGWDVTFPTLYFPCTCFFQIRFPIYHIMVS